MTQKLLVVIIVIIAALACVRWVGSETAHANVLHAPTYYIAITGDMWDSETLRFHGASNLPPEAEISIEAGDWEGNAVEASATAGCVSVGKTGLFRGEIRAPKGASFHQRRNGRFDHSLFITANFNTYSCKQPASVLTAVGKKGQYLGNDNYDNAKDVAAGWTEGMFNNPQLYQVSGWYFGLQTTAEIE